MSGLCIKIYAKSAFLVKVSYLLLCRVIPGLRAEDSRRLVQVIHPSALIGGQNVTDCHNYCVFVYCMYEQQ